MCFIRFMSTHPPPNKDKDKEEDDKDDLTLFINSAKLDIGRATEVVARVRHGNRAISVASPSAWPPESHDVSSCWLGGAVEGGICCQGPRLTPLNAITQGGESLTKFWLQAAEPWTPPPLPTHTSRHRGREEVDLYG